MIADATSNIATIVRACVKLYIFNIRPSYTPSVQIFIQSVSERNRTMQRLIGYRGRRIIKIDEVRKIFAIF
jgi:hypothetical protein